ncbi:MAG: N-acetylmuramoyl-L-alanine amidase [Clostridia bacterium]|nr:N-acetylmuramoyl-L-alanine amidase [Clostridia bacterium]
MSSKIKRKLILKLALFSIVFAVIAAMLGYTGYTIGKRDISLSASAGEVKSRKVIIDPGHGGEDGGATGINGRLEKELNLELSKKLDAVFALMNVDAIMTRESDVSLGEDAEKGKRKMTDLKRRLELAENNPDALFLSVHMNKFPQEVCHGLQIWYSPNSENSKRLADIVRNNISTRFEIGNMRENKKASSSIYLLDRMKNTSVLIECGFISNTDECERLCDFAYQQRLAACIACSVLDFCSNVG